MGVCETVSVSLSSVTGLGAGSQIQVHVLYSEESRGWEVGHGRITWNRDNLSSISPVSTSILIFQHV